MRKGIAVSLVMLVVASACGGDSADGLSETERALSDAIAVEYFIDDEDFSSNPVTPGEAECLGTGIVGRIGVEGLAGIGVTVDSMPPDNLVEDASDEQLDAFLDVYFDCLDVASLYAEGFANDSAGFFNIECLTREFREGEVLRQLVRSSIVGEADENSEFMDQLIPILVGCLPE